MAIGARAIVVIAVLSTIVGRTAHAQFGGDARMPVRAASTTAFPGVLTSTARREAIAPRPDMVRTAAFRATVSAGGIVVLRVPVPEEMLAVVPRNSRSISFRVMPEASVRVLGKTDGVVSDRDSTVSVTLSVSRQLLAGKRAAALVEFSTAADKGVAVPIEIDVPVKRDLQLVVPDAYLGGVRGAWTVIAVEVLNRGNDHEPVSIKTVLPQGWRSSNEDFANVVHLTPNVSRRSAIRVWIPSQSPQGQALVRIVLVSNGVTVAQQEVRVEVRDAAEGRLAGPQLMLSGVGASAPDGSSAYGYAATIAGMLSDSVAVSGRFSMSGASTGGAAFGTSRAGVMTSPPQLSVESPRVRVDAGAFGTELHELGGSFVNGMGASTRLTSGRYSVSAFGARPLSFTPTALFGAGEGTLSGAGVERRGDAMTYGVNGVRLYEANTARSLDAITMHARTGSVGGSRATGEVGYRRFGSGSGVGYAGAFRQEFGGSLVDVRAVHAPGGSQAFARTENELNVALSQRLGTRGSIAAGGWRQRDGTSLLGALSSVGWYVAPQVTLQRIGTTLGVDGRGNRFTSSSRAGKFMSEDREVGASVNSRHGQMYMNVRSALGQVSRGIGMTGVAVPTTTGTRLDSRASIGAFVAGGSMEMMYSSQQFDGAAGMQPGNQVFSARLDRLRIPVPMAIPLFANADVQRYFSGSGAPPAWSLRGSVSATVYGGMTVSFQAERNPYLYAGNAGGLRSFLYALRIDRTASLPRLAARRDRTVFVDLNGNGARDDGERGIAGVKLQCGSVVIVSDADGRFACSMSSELGVDARTVPTGLLAPHQGVAAARRTDIALRPVEAQRVRLITAAQDTFQVSRENLARVVVIARDAAGVPWAARSVGNGDFVFDALPTGRYQVELDARDVAEPLRPTTPLPELWIRESEAGSMLTIELKPRNIRIRMIEGNNDPLVVPAKSDGEDVPAQWSSPRDGRKPGARGGTT